MVSFDATSVPPPPPAPLENLSEDEDIEDKKDGTGEGIDHPGTNTINPIWP